MHWADGYGAPLRHTDPDVVKCTGAPALADVKSVIANSPLGVQGVMVFYLRDDMMIELVRNRDELICLINVQTNVGGWDGWWRANFHNVDGRAILGLKHFTDAEVDAFFAEVKRKSKH